MSYEKDRRASAAQRARVDRGGFIGRLTGAVGLTAALVAGAGGEPGAAQRAAGPAGAGGPAHSPARGDPQDVNGDWLYYNGNDLYQVEPDGALLSVRFAAGWTPNSIAATLAAHPDTDGAALAARPIAEQVSEQGWIEVPLRAGLTDADV